MVDTDRVDGALRRFSPESHAANFSGNCLTRPSDSASETVMISVKISSKAATSASQFCSSLATTSPFVSERWRFSRS
jgi:hypothetical protein